MTDRTYMNFLKQVSEEDIRHLEEKDKSYGGSWMRRGGVGAFMMLARKWDRLENILTTPDKPNTQYDIFQAIQSDPAGQDGSALAEVRDLRRYLLLVEAWLAARTHAQPSNEKPPPPPPDVPVYLHGGGLDRLVPRYDSWIGKTVEATMNGKTYSGVVDDESRDTVAFGEGFNRMRFFKKDVRLAPVPAEDSNRHADRDWRAGHYVDGRGWKIQPVIPIDLYDRLANQKLRERFVPTGRFAQVDRRLLSPEKLEESFSRLNQTITLREYGALAEHTRELYEPRTGVVDEYQLRREFREAWGR